MFTLKKTEQRQCYNSSAILQPACDSSAGDLTCFQEASAFKVGAHLGRDEASSHHVTGGGSGHVQLEVLDGSFSATWGRTRGIKDQLGTANKIPSI